MLDDWEILHGLSPSSAADAMLDGDGLINLHEYWAGTDPLTPDGSNTLLSVASRSIDDRIRDIDPAAAVPRFVNYFVNGSNGVFQLNTNFWARDLDLSCVSVWNTSANPGGRTATLITRKHVVMAEHWPANNYKFCDTNGVVLSRNVVQWQQISDDLRLGRLNESLPNSFKPASVPSTNIAQYINFGKYLPTFCLNHNKGATVLELDTLDAEATRDGGGHFYHYGHTSYTNLVSSQRRNIRSATVDGNSGCPVFMVADDKLILLFAVHLVWTGVPTWTPFRGPLLPIRIEAIQRRIDEWEGENASLYQIEPFDFSSFDEIINQ